MKRSSGEFMYFPLLFEMMEKLRAIEYGFYVIYTYR